MSRKFLFLDVDGVLNNWDMLHRLQKEGNGEACPITGDPYPYSYIDMRCTAILNEIVERVPDVYIVVSSSWRLFHTKESFIEILTKRGFKYTDKIIDATPRFYESNMVPLQNWKWNEADRGLEIGYWLQNYAHTYSNIESDDVHQYQIAILDDDSNMWRLSPFLVKTNMNEIGLNDSHIDRVVKLLHTPIGIELPDVHSLLAPDYLRDRSPEEIGSYEVHDDVPILGKRTK